MLHFIWSLSKFSHLKKVTHNPDIECYADRILYLADGMFEKQAINSIQTRLNYDDYIQYLNSTNVH